MMSVHNLDKLEQAIASVHGDIGKKWWECLPQFLGNLARTRGLTLKSPFKELSFNYVLPVLGPNKEAWVLKTSVPNAEFSREIAALTHFKGRGAVPLIDANAEEGWMLLGQLLPGTRLVDCLDEKQTIPIAVNLMQRLWSSVFEQEHFIPLTQWLRSLEKLDTNPLHYLLSQPLRDFVKGRTAELLSSQGEPVLLHGDLHHYNILQHHEAWFAIDPKGIIGEKEFEIGAFLRNPLCVIDDPLETKALARNLDWIIDLSGFNRERVLSWCIIYAILCVCWSIEDNMLEKISSLIAYAERLYTLL